MLHPLSMPDRYQHNWNGNLIGDRRAKRALSFLTVIFFVFLNPCTNFSISGWKKEIKSQKDTAILLIQHKWTKRALLTVSFVFLNPCTNFSILGWNKEIKNQKNTVILLIQHKWTKRALLTVIFVFLNPCTNFSILGWNKEPKEYCDPINPA